MFVGLASFYGISTNNAEPDKTPQNAASDQFLHCFLTECTFIILNEIVNFYPKALKFEMASSD